MEYLLRRSILFFRAITPGVFDMDKISMQPFQHIMRMTRSWDSTMSMIPKGGDTIWGGLDWSPEGGCECSLKKIKSNNNKTEVQNRIGELGNTSHVPYGRMISFGKDITQLHSSKIERVGFKVLFQLSF